MFTPSIWASTRNAIPSPQPTTHKTNGTANALDRLRNKRRTRIRMKIENILRGAAVSSVSVHFTFASHVFVTMTRMCFVYIDEYRMLTLIPRMHKEELICVCVCVYLRVASSHDNKIHLWATKRPRTTSAKKKTHSSWWLESRVVPYRTGWVLL